MSCRSYDKDDDSDKTFVLVDKAKLLELFLLCPLCQAETSMQVVHQGSMVRIKQECLETTCRFKRTWDSQKQVGGGVSAGNIAISCAVLFSGSAPAKALRMLGLMGMHTISYSTYMQHQKVYLIPSVEQVYQRERQSLMAGVAGTRLILSGDGRWQYLLFSTSCLRLDICIHFGNWSINF